MRSCVVQVSLVNALAISYVMVCGEGERTNDATDLTDVCVEKAYCYRVPRKTLKKKVLLNAKIGIYTIIYYNKVIKRWYPGAAVRCDDLRQIPRVMYGNEPIKS